jgi:hypothetical protein
MRPRWKKLILIAPLAVAGLLLFVAVGGAVVQLLWNWLLPSLFGWREVSFWQALGVLALCRILFGGFGCHGSGRSHIGRRLQEGYVRMSPEERERFRQRLREKFGFDPPAGQSQV